MADTGNKSSVLPETAEPHNGCAMASDGSAIFLVRRAYDGTITHVWAGIAGRHGIKPLTFYTLGDNGAPIEGE